jgi:hypothetical protein
MFGVVEGQLWCFAALHPIEVHPTSTVIEISHRISHHVSPADTASAVMFDEL